MAYYTMTAEDLTKISNAGVVATVNGNPMTVGFSVGLTVGDVVKFTCNSGKEFYKTGANSSVNWFTSGGNSYVNPVLSVNNTVATYTTPSGGFPAGSQPWNPWKYVFNIATQNAAIPLGWLEHPTNLVMNSDAVFTWQGGSANYSVLVLNPDGSTFDSRAASASTTYTLNIPTGSPVGDYVVRVQDSAAPPAAINSTVAVTDIPKPVRYTFSNSDISNLVAQKVTLKINGINVVSGSVVKEGDLLTANTSDEYRFYIDTYSSINFTNTSTYLPFTLSDDKKSATVIMVNTDWLVFNVKTKPPVPATLAGNNVYTITPTLLAEVNKNRFEFINTSSGGVFMDYGDYILSVLQLPFTLDPDLISGDATIMLADHSTGVTSKRVKTDVITLDMGKITIPKINHNLLDFNNVGCILHLPRAGSMNIDVEYVVGQTISIEYLIDVYSGKATINIYSSKIDDVISSKETDLGINVPYANQDGGKVYNQNVDMGGNNNITKAFIEIVSSDAPLKDSVFSAVIVDEKILNTQNGFITVDNIELVSKAIKSEKDEILSILNGGVIIK